MGTDKVKNNNKKSKTDFTKDMLPTTRREVFFDVLKLHWQNFLIYGILILLATLPMQVVSLNEMFTVSDFNSALSEATEEQTQLLLHELVSFKILYAFLKIPCLMIIMLVLSGFMKVIRNYAWEEPVEVIPDFASGFRENAPQMAALGFTVGVCYALSKSAYVLAQYGSSEFSLALMVPMCIFIVCVLPMFAYSVSCISVYTNKFFGVLKIGMTVAIASPLKTLTALAVCLLPFLLEFIPNVYGMIAARIITGLLIPFIMLGWFLHSYNLFDAFINEKSFPELVGRGLYKPECEKTPE